MGWSWLKDISVMQHSRSSGTRSAILEILDKNSNCLPEMAIYRHLKARGINVTQQAVSRNLEVLERSGYVWKTRRLDKEVNRELWHYISAVPFFDSITEDIHKEILSITIKAIEKNVDRAPQFENFQTLQSFIDNIIQRASELVICDEELYSQLSKIKPYAESALMIKEYKTAVSNICEAIKANRLLGYGDRRVNLGLPSSLALSHPHDIAKAIVDCAIKGEKRWYLHSIDFLQKNTTGELRGRLENSIKWVQCCSELKIALTRKDKQQSRS